MKALIYFFQVFGAYCSSTWATRNVKDDQGQRQQYFGTGETFLFTFSQGSPTRYSWVNAENNTTAVSEVNETKAEAHKKELFMCGKHDMIAIGKSKFQILSLKANCPTKM